MNSDILIVCEELNTLVNDNRPKSDILDNCAKIKMIRVFEDESKEFDNLLKKLEINIDYNNYSQVKVCVTKLLKLLSNNRKHLLKNIGRLYANG